MAEETILDRLPDGRPRPSVSMYNHAVDVANANYRRAEAAKKALTEAEARATTAEQEPAEGAACFDAQVRGEPACGTCHACLIEKLTKAESQLRSLQSQQETLRRDARVNQTVAFAAAEYARTGRVQHDDDAPSEFPKADPAPSAPPRPEGWQTIAVLLTETDIEGLYQYIEFHGGAHTRACPADDTCDCKYKPLNDAVNNICQKAFDAQVRAAPPPVVPPTPERPNRS